MLKPVAIFFTFLCVLYVAGCGNTTAPVYITPTPLVTPPAAPISRTVMGGSIQGVGAVALTNTVTTFAGSSAGFSNISTAGSATFYRPIALTTDGTNLYVADYYNNAIRRINIQSGNIQSGNVTTIAGNTAGLPGSADGTGTVASFYYPSAITTDGTNLFVADSVNYTIRQVVIASGLVSTLAGSVGLPGSLDGVGTYAKFNGINGITSDGGDYLYVTDSNNTVRRIKISTKEVTTLAGSPGTTGSANCGAGAQATARFNQPGHITTDGPNLYVTDWGNSTIRKIDLATGAVTTIAGNVRPGGQEGLSTDGIGQAASFNQPNGITTDGTNLYVTESYGYVSKIRKIVLATGEVTTIAGGVVINPNNQNLDPTKPQDHSGSADGVGSTASFNVPVGITTDGTSLYIADEFNNRIRKIQ